MCLPLFILGLLSSRAVSATSPKTAPATRPARIENFLDRERLAERDAWEETTAMKPVANVRRDSLERISIEDGRLALEFGGVQAPELTRVNVNDADGLWLVMGRNHRRGRAGLLRPTLLIDRYDFDQADPDAIWATYLSASPGMITISAESLRQRIIFSENPALINLTILDKDPQARPHGPRIVISAHTLAELHNAHPAEYRACLLPLIGKLTDVSRLSPGLADIYQVFADIRADEASTRELQSLLLAVDSTAPADREKARKEIAAMGARGILAAMRMDTSTLTPEQQSAVSELIARGRRAKVENAAAAKHDLNFLLDCMESDAPDIRHAALQQLTVELGKPVAFDENQNGPAALAAVDALRKRLLGGSAAKDPAN